MASELEVGKVRVSPANITAELQLYRDDSTINAAGTAIGDINFGGGDADNDNAARLRVKSDAAWTASSSPTAFEFQTCPSGSESPQTRLVIDSTGLCTFSNGVKNEQGIYGGQITIADDAVGTITPPRQGVMMAISYNNDQAFPTHQTYVGILWCDTGSSQNTTKLTSEGGGITVHSAVDLSAGGETSSVDGNINISTVSGTIQLKNRIGSSATWWYNFIA